MRLTAATDITANAIAAVAMIIAALSPVTGAEAAVTVAMHTGGTRRAVSETALTV